MNQEQHNQTPDPSLSVPVNATLLGFDFGLKRIGVAVGQRITGSATPLTTLQSRDTKPDWKAITALIEEWRPAVLIVGEPRHLNGDVSEMTHAAHRFSRQLEGRFQLPVALVDERLSSREAERITREARSAGRKRRVDKGDIDKLAAQIILQSWLDTHNGENCEQH